MMRGVLYVFDVDSGEADRLHFLVVFFVFRKGIKEAVQLEIGSGEWQMYRDHYYKLNSRKIEELSISESMMFHADDGSH